MTIVGLGKAICCKVSRWLMLSLIYQCGIYLCIYIQGKDKVGRNKLELAAVANMATREGGTS